MARSLASVWGCIFGRSLWLPPPWAKAGKPHTLGGNLCSLQFRDCQILFKTLNFQRELHERGQLKGQIDLWVRR